MPLYSVHKLPFKQTWRQNYFHAYTIHIHYTALHCVAHFRQHQINFIQVYSITFTYLSFVDCILWCAFRSLNLMSNEDGDMQREAVNLSKFKQHFESRFISIVTSLFYNSSHIWQSFFGVESWSWTRCQIVIGMSTSGNQSRTMEMPFYTYLCQIWRDQF